VVAAATLSIIWLVALGGGLFAILAPQRMEAWALYLYLALGWLGLFIMYGLMSYGSASITWLMGLGGLCYTLGTIFFASRRIPLSHTIWHIFVLAGSALHYVAVVKL
jgi:hemolysin III